MEVAVKEDDDYLSKGDLEAMTIPALRHLCKLHALEREGGKDERVQRLRNWVLLSDV